jgi:hypothetical protein
MNLIGTLYFELIKYFFSHRAGANLVIAKIYNIGTDDFVSRFQKIDLFIDAILDGTAFMAVSIQACKEFGTFGSL